MNIALWIVQIILAGGYGFAGSMKILKPDSFRTNPQTESWARERSDANMRSIGIPEVLGALGLILPMVTGILPWLTPLAAVGLSVIQLIALFATPFADGIQLQTSKVLMKLILYLVAGLAYGYTVHLVDKRKS